MNMLATRGLPLTEAREKAINDVESGRLLNKALVEYKAFRQLQASKKSCLHWLNVEMAEHIMDHIQLLLDLRNVVANPTQKYEDLHGLLRYLSSKFQLLPPSLIIHDVEKEGTNAVAGGGFADIWRGKVKGKPVCLKVLRLFLEQDERARMNIRDQFCREALVWRQLRHPNILPLLGINSDLFSPSFCLISSWMKNKDIITYLKANPVDDVSSVLSDIAAGINYLHSQDPPIVHGDIRGANILVTDDLRCCLADFGLSVISTESEAWTIATSSSFLKGAIHWLAPEYITPNTSPKAPHTSRDIYAFGCTIVEILTRKLPFCNCPNETAVLLSLLNCQRPIRPENVWCPDRLWRLAVRCWEQDSCNRPSAHEIYIILQRIPVIVSDPSIQLQPLPTESRPPYATKVKHAKEEARTQEGGFAFQSRTPHLIRTTDVFERRSSVTPPSYDVSTPSIFTIAEGTAMGSLSTVALSGPLGVPASTSLITQTRDAQEHAGEPQSRSNSHHTTIVPVTMHISDSDYSYSSVESEVEMSVFKFSELRPISQLYKTSVLKAPSPDKQKFKPNSSYLNRVTLFQGDITKLEVDSIVNAANKSLLGGGGVDGAIHAAAGWGLYHECMMLNGCETGFSKITWAYRLPAKNIIHTVGPVHSSTPDGPQKAKQLASCYQTSLDLALQNSLRHIAFPSISTGSYGYPIEDATHIALNAVRKHFESEDGSTFKLDRVIFVVWSDKDKSVYESLIPEYFPPFESETDIDVLNPEVSPEDTQNPEESQETLWGRVWG